MAGSVTIQSNNITGPSGLKVIGPLIIAGVGNIITVQEVAFASGTFISITPPAGATAAVIVPPSGNTVAITLKGVTGDTGIPLQPSQPSIITFANPTAPASFGITSGAAITGNIEISYW